MKKYFIFAFGILFTVSALFANTQSFPDVRPGDWFFEYIESIKNWGIIQGQGDGTFAPAKGINRAEFSKMIFLYDERVDEKINEKIPEKTQEKSLPTPMYLHSYDRESPADCPQEWNEFEYKINWRNEFSKNVWTRTCLIEKECKILSLQAYNEDPKVCPSEWTEADMKLTKRDGTKRQFTRTCYICK